MALDSSFSATFWEFIGSMRQLRINASLAERGSVFEFKPHGPLSYITKHRQCTYEVTNQQLAQGLWHVKLSEIQRNMALGRHDQAHSCDLRSQLWWQLSFSVTTGVSISSLLIISRLILAYFNYLDTLSNIQIKIGSGSFQQSTMSSYQYN